MTHKQLNKNPIRPITKLIFITVMIQMKRSLVHLQDCQKIQFGTPTGSSEDSIQIETPQVPTNLIRSRHNDTDSSRIKPVTEFEPPKENGQQTAIKDNKLRTNNLTVDIPN